MSGDVQGRILRYDPGLSLVPVEMKKRNKDVDGISRCQGPRCRFSNGLPPTEVRQRFESCYQAFDRSW